MNKIEIIISSLIGIVLFYIIIPKNNNKIKEEEITFEIPAIEAWKDTHDRWAGTEGDIVKIKFIVESKNTNIHSSDRLIVGIGLENITIVDETDAPLIFKKGD